MVDRPVRMTCETCGSELVTRDAWAEWDVAEQNWVLAAVYDYAFCHACEESTEITAVICEADDEQTP